MSHFSNSNMGLSRHGAERAALEKIWAAFPNRYLKRTVMASQPSYTVNSGFTISGGTNYPGVKTIGTPTQVVVGDVPWNYIRGGNLLNTNGYITFNNIANNTSKNMFAISFMHDGAALEIEGYGGNWWIKINDEYMTAAAVALSGNQKIYIPFGSRDTRRIDVFGDDTANFRSINIGATDAIYKSEIRGPRVMILGDSVTACKSGTPVSTNRTLDSYSQWMCDVLGWDDIWNCGIGGSGFVAGTTYGSRVANDIIPYNPDILIITGSPNDAATAYATQLAAAKSLFATIKTALPNTIIFTIGTFASGGQGDWYANLTNNSRNAVRDASLEYNIPFFDFIERPFRDGYTPVSGTLAAGTSIGATSFTSNAVFSPLACVEIEGNDRAQIKTISGSGTGPFTYAIDSTLKVGHLAGVTINEIGHSFWTGTGYTGATTGWGNSDIYVQADNTHPTIDGYKNIGLDMCKIMKEKISEFI